MQRGRGAKGRGEKGQGAKGKNKILPGSEEENQVQYGSTALPQLQSCGHDSQCGAGTGTGTPNVMGNEQSLPVNVPNKRVRENEPTFFQPRLLRTNSHNQDISSNIGSLTNLNHVSTIMRQSGNPSVSFACESSRNGLPGALIDQQNEEFARYIKRQGENLLNGVRELNQRHNVALMNACGQWLNRKLHEKDLEIMNMNCKINELVNRINQATAESNSWFCLAKDSESIINALQSKIQQLMVVQEGMGQNVVNDDTDASRQVVQNPVPKCRACNIEQVSFLVLPCSHLCLCVSCEGLVTHCPVCQVMKTSTIGVNMC